jgi:hypothetical protein
VVFFNARLVIANFGSAAEGLLLVFLESLFQSFDIDHLLEHADLRLPAVGCLVSYGVPSL